jgi:hypothetical protein
MHKKLTEQDTPEKDSKRVKSLYALKNVLYACLCIFGFRLFLKVDMHIILKFILVNISTIWGIMAVNGFRKIFKTRSGK